ncbi:histidinol-phosphatase, inositol monophosphatase family [Arboricoccus pini]|uniref:Histidinol-phosphatase n=1 Tax=Arboricoccus pini TaxID=1963835 RepID=A0A212RKE8_9PROT|nr:histidinol-phosphatase [Arboricoccus pini]SNB72932.1 histidinol-phosphatase, inositol monophosphatase family [Arboricoccus pini]
MTNPPSSMIAELQSFAMQLADSAGALALRYFREPLAIESKADLSPVTIADRSIEETIRRMIGERFPEHGILGEEYGADALDQEFVWVIDPIDGTKAFVSGNPLFGTLLGLLHQGRPLLGVIDAPFTHERWHGLPGRTEDNQGRPCRGRQVAQIQEAILYTTSPDSFTSAGRTAFASVAELASLTRYGGDCYAYALVAAGHVDAVIEEGLQPYDFLPLIPVIEGAGGCITDWDGSALSLQSHGRVIAAANPILHRELVARMRGCP